MKKLFFIAIYLFANASQAVDVGIGIGKCTGGAPDDPYNLCRAGVAAKVFIRHIHMATDSIGVEAELYHFSHPESHDLHPSQYDERTRQHQGGSINLFYRF